MTGSEDHRGSRLLADLPEVSHARTAIITDLFAVAGTACHRLADRGRVARRVGLSAAHAAQALQIRRRGRRLDRPKRFTTETVYAITSLNVHQARPAQLAAWIRGHWSIENKLHWVRDVTYDEDRSQIRTRTGAQVMAALPNAAISILRITGVTNIAAANRHHARDSTRPLALLGIT